MSSQVLTTVRIQNYRVLADVTIPLEPFTVLVGPNGSGKTSVVTVIDEAMQQIRGTGGGPAATVDLAVGDVRATIQNKRLSYHVDLLSKADAFSKLAFCRLLALNATAIRASAQVFASPEMSETGERFAVFLATLIQRDRRALDRIEADLRLVVSNVEEVASERKDQNNAFTIKFAKVGWVPSEAVSEGTAIALALLSLLHVPEPPNLLLIEDLDRGLHPRAQREVIGILRRIVELRPGLRSLRQHTRRTSSTSFPPRPSWCSLSTTRATRWPAGSVNIRSSTNGKRP